MSTKPRPRTRNSWAGWAGTDLIAVGAGIIAGILLDLLTVLVARYGLESNGWSLRGNGALVVPFGLGPALLTAAWTALALRARSRTDWLQRGVAAGVIGGLLVVASAVLPILLGSGVAAIARALLIASLAWLTLAVVLACFTRGSARSVGMHLVAGLAFAVALAVSFVLTSHVFPPGA